MENRRENFRHPFPPGERIPVSAEVKETGQKIEGQIADLSSWGIGIRVLDPSIYLTVGERLTVRFILPQKGSFEVRASISNVRKSDDGWHYGVQFLPNINQKDDARRDKLIWEFLMEEQRRASR